MRTRGAQNPLVIDGRPLNCCINTFLLWLGDLSADGLHELLAVVGDLAVLAVVVTLLLANLLGLLHATVLVDGVEVALLPEAKKKN